MLSLVRIAGEKIIVQPEIKYSKVKSFHLQPHGLVKRRLEHPEIRYSKVKSFHLQPHGLVKRRLEQREIRYSKVKSFYLQPQVWTSIKKRLWPKKIVFRSLTFYPKLFLQAK